MIWQTTKKLQTIDLLSVEVCAHYLLPQLQLESSENLTTRQKIGALFQDLIQEKIPILKLGKNLVIICN